MSVALEILAIVAIAAVVIVLVRGLFNMAQGGTPSRSNQLMQARVLLQFIAIVLVLLVVYFTGK
ncbi:MAG: twin transmembrane helix small protein [Rhizobiaceae bacterium]